MPDPSLMPLYLAALVAVFLAPGPDMALVLATAAGRGTRAGLRTACGIAAARYLHVLAAGLGLAALFAAHPALHAAVRAFGAAYLLWLAWRTLRAGGGLAQPEARPQQESPRPAGPSRAEALRLDLGRGFLTNLLNPKALLFCGLLLPQFAAPERGPLLPQYLWLGAVLVGVGLAFDAAYALLAGGLLRRLLCGAGEEGRLARARRWFMGSVFAALAARLAVG
jgi:threonine/homoserine/homoserine lactone efflux protein